MEYYFACCNVLALKSLFVADDMYSLEVDASSLYMFDPVTMFWEDLSVLASGKIPGPRTGHGISSIGSLFYVHGGLSNQGSRCLLLRSVAYFLQANNTMCCKKCH
jgi:hypothetical protein